MKSKIEKSKYTHKTYCSGFEINVIPKHREQDVLYHLFTGYYIRNRSLEGVSYDIKKDKEFI